MEERFDDTFRRDSATYQQMREMAVGQGQLFEFPDDETIPCFCGD